MMAAALSVPDLATPALPPDDNEDLVARLTREGLISMREAAVLYSRNTHKSTPTRHTQRGVKLADGTLLRLESIRVSGRVCTSRAAVLRFFARQSGTAPVETPVPPTPTRRIRAAAAASAKLDELLGG